MENGYNIGTIVLALAYLGKHAIVNCDHPLARVIASPIFAIQVCKALIYLVEYMCIYDYMRFDHCWKLTVLECWNYDGFGQFSQT